MNEDGRAAERFPRRAFAAQLAQGPGRRRPARRRPDGLPGWLGDPRNAVFLGLALALLVGGGRKWLQARRAREAVDRLSDPGVTPEAIEAAADHERSALVDLFRLLETAPDPAQREAAGRALARLWAQDQLIIEEEKAIVARGYQATWHARRRYPRDLRRPIPFQVTYGVPFLRDEAGEVRPSNLEWSHRISGADRAALEKPSPWQAGDGRVAFALDPVDFPRNGPHRLVLQATARTVGLTSAWEMELPHVAFSFEFDPNLKVEALLALADEVRGQEIAAAVRLRPAPAGGDVPRFLDLDGDYVLRDPPELAVSTPLPCDLAHRLALEFEGVPDAFEAGEVVLSGQGTNQGEAGATRRFEVGPIRGLPPGAIDRAGERRVRAILTADPERGWGDPAVRSIWPGTIVTDWLPVRIIRR